MLPLLNLREWGATTVCGWRKQNETLIGESLRESSVGKPAFFYPEVRHCLGPLRKPQIFAVDEGSSFRARLGGWEGVGHMTNPGGYLYTDLWSKEGRGGNKMDWGDLDDRIFLSPLQK